MLNRRAIFLIVSGFYVFYILMPLIADLTHIPIQFASLFCVVVFYGLYPKAFFNNSIKWFLIYIGILCFYVLIGKGITIGIGTVSDSKKLIIEAAWILPTLSIFSIIDYLQDFKLLKKITIISLVAVSISFLYLIPISISDKGALRMAVSDAMYDAGVKLTGVPNYTLLHSYIIVIPALLYLCKRLKGTMKYLIIMVILLYAYIIFNSYITTNLVLFLICFLFFISDRGNIKKSTIGLVFILLVVFILHSEGVFVRTFDYLTSVFSGTAVEPKIHDFQELYLTGHVDGTIEARSNLHQISWNSFFQSPLWGKNSAFSADIAGMTAPDVINAGGSAVVGGHSSLVDRLGGMGLLGFVPFIMILMSQFKTCKKYMADKSMLYYYYLGVFSAVMLLYQKGLFGQEGWFTLVVFMPGLLMSSSNTKKETLFNCSSEEVCYTSFDDKRYH